MSDKTGNVTTALYRGPNDAYKFEQTIDQSIVTAASLKSTYFAELRGATKHLQENINVFLTRKMEEDKNKTGTDAPTKLKRSRDEEEEEGYGEEKIEED